MGRQERIDSTAGALRPLITGDRPGRELGVRVSPKKGMRVPTSNGGPSILNGHFNGFNFKESRAKIERGAAAVDLELALNPSTPIEPRKDTQSDDPFTSLGLIELPVGVSLEPNGHFPLEDLADTKQLKLLRKRLPTTRTILTAPLTRDEYEGSLEAERWNKKRDETTELINEILDFGKKPVTSKTVFEDFSSIGRIREKEVRAAARDTNRRHKSGQMRFS